MTIKEAQEAVDKWIKEYGVRSRKASTRRPKGMLKDIRITRN